MANPVLFDRASAERIASAVRKVEIGDRSEAALRFRRELPQSQRKVFRVATFTGAWSIGATKTVTFKYQTSTPNTANAVNLFFPMPAPAGATDCAIARDGTAWHLIDVPLETATAVFVGATATGVVVSATASQTVVSNVLIAATLNTANCAITVSRTQTTASVSVVQSTATAVVISSTFTATFVRFKVS
jgi:hypothetical protein